LYVQAINKVLALKSAEIGFRLYIYIIYGWV